MQRAIPPVVSPLLDRNKQTVTNICGVVWAGLLNGRTSKWNMRKKIGNATKLLLCDTGVGTVKQKLRHYSMIAISVIWLSSCAEKTEFVSSQSQSNWKFADPAALAGAEPEAMPDIMPQTHYAAGRLFEKQGAALRASKQYKKALLRDPKHVPSLSRLGMLYAKQGHYPQAEEYLQRAVEIWPNSPQVRNNLGFCYIMQERWYDAEAEFRNTLKLNPSFVRARVNLAMALSKQNRFEEALGEFRLAVPEPEAYYNLGLLYHSAQRYQEAASAFEIALQKNPKLTIAKLRLDRIKLQLERSREFQVDVKSPQSTEFASNNGQNQTPAAHASSTKVNQPYTMQPVETPNPNQNVSNPVAATEPTAQTASLTTSTSKFASNESAPAPVEPQVTEPTTQPEAPIQTADVRVVRTMEPVEYTTTPSSREVDANRFESKSQSMQASSQPVEEQPVAMQTPNTHNSATRRIETREMYPIASASETVEIEVETSEPVASNEMRTTNQQESKAIVADAPSADAPSKDTFEQAPVASEIQSVDAVYVKTGQSQTALSPFHVKPTSQPAALEQEQATQTNSIATTKESNAPAISNSDALVLEATPYEEFASPAKLVDLKTQNTEPQQRSVSRSIAADPTDNSTFASDLSEIQSVKPSGPKAIAAPKKAKTATHRSNPDQAEMKPMGTVGAAPKKQAPQPIMQAMPIKNSPKQSAPEISAPKIIEMQPIESASKNDEVEPATEEEEIDEEEIEIVEMEAVND